MEIKVLTGGSKQKLLPAVPPPPGRTCRFNHLYFLHRHTLASTPGYTDNQAVFCLITGVCAPRGKANPPPHTHTYEHAQIRTVRCRKSHPNSVAGRGGRRTSRCLIMPILSASQRNRAFKLVSMARPIPSNTTKSASRASSFTTSDTCFHSQPLQSVSLTLLQGVPAQLNRCTSDSSSAAQRNLNELMFPEQKDSSRIVPPQPDASCPPCVVCYKSHR